MPAATNSTKRGVDVLLYANTGTVAVPVYTIIEGQRGATLSEEAETIDTTSKTSAGQAKEYEYGLYGWKISLNGVHDKAGIAYTALRNALRTKAKILVQVNDSGNILEGNTLVTSCEYDAPHDGEQTYSIELQGIGTLTAKVAP